MTEDDLTSKISQPSAEAAMSLVLTKKPHTLYHKISRFVLKNPTADTRNSPKNVQKNPKRTKKYPVCTKNPLLPFPEWTPTNPICTNKSTLSTQKKKQL